MIRIEVTAYDGRPPAQALKAEFDELGGTIGRAEGNTLVLPDPKRYISRTHASVIFRAGGFVLRDVGSASPVVVNGKQLGPGREQAIRDGDVVTMANYTMQVVAVRSTAPGASPAGATIAPSSAVKDDPLAAFGTDPSDANPFADLMAPSPRTPATPHAAAAVKRTQESAKPIERPPPPNRRVSEPASILIPEDFDPFAEPAPETSRAAARGTDPLDFGPATREQNIDDIFGLSGTEGSDPINAGPLAGPSDDPGEGSLLDPLVAIGAVQARKRPMQPPQRNDAPEIHGAMHLMPVNPEPVSQGSAEVADNQRRASPAPPPATVTEQPTAAAVDALLREFLAGAGIAHLDIPEGLTPKLMNVLGQLFRESTQGTLDLLLARTTAKRELRSSLTTIVARENNPLKFSPSVEAAMIHLLAPHRGVGFMAPVPALKDAYDDLRAHEFGVMAGMRAALAGALARFDPERLERRLAQKPVLDALLPINRQARLWALFGELYSDISREAEDNFHTVFGTEFLRAYEEQIAKLDQNANNAKD